MRQHSTGFGCALRVLTRVLAIALISAVLAASARAPAQCIPAIEPVGTYGGLDGFVRTLTPLPNNSVFLAGEFTIAGRQSVSSPAIWNGSTFQSLAPITDGQIFTSAVHNNQIVIGGAFRFPNHAETTTVATWDGAAWIPLGQQPSGTIYILRSINGHLLAGGDFSLPGSTAIIHLATFDGTTWQPHAYQPDDTVFAISSLDSLLLIGGDFNYVNGVATHRIALLAGGTPIPLDRGLDRRVNTVIFYHNSIIAGGQFESDFRSITPGVAIFDGIHWQPLAGGLTGEVFDLREINGRLYAAGLLDSGVVYLENDTWHSGANPLDNIAYAVAPGPTGPVAGGLFSHAGNYPAGAFAPLINNTWTPLYPGTDGPITCSCMYNGQLVVAGNFTAIEGVPCRIARYTGSEWIPILTNLDGTIRGMTAWNGYLVVVGDFRSIDTGLVTRSVARWDGVSWSRFRYDFSGTLNVAFVDQGSLVVGGAPGSMLQENGTFLHSAAWLTYYNLGSQDWSNTSWYPGLYVQDALRAGDTLWVGGGSFSATVSALRGSTLMPACGPQGVVRALATDGVHIFAGGTFSTFLPTPGAEARPCTNLVSWNGSEWSEVSLAIDGPIYSLAWFDGSLYIGGNFPGTAFYPRGGLLRINEQGLLERPKYFDGTVTFLSAKNSKLLVSGLFGSVDSQHSPFITWLTCPDCRADFNHDDVVDIFDYLDFIELFAAADIRCDFNGDSQVDLFDYLDFLDSLARGC